MRGEKIYQQSANLLEAYVDGELVALDANQGTCLGFNRTATRIWELLAEPMTLSALCTRLASEFETSAERCQPEVEHLLADLQQSGLVVAKEA